MAAIRQDDYRSINHFTIPRALIATTRAARMWPRISGRWSAPRCRHSSENEVSPRPSFPGCLRQTTLPAAAPVTRTGRCPRPSPRRSRASALRRLGRRLVAFRWIFGHQLFDNGHKGRRQVGPQLEQRRRRIDLMLNQLLRERALGKRHLTGEQEIQHAAEAVKVGAAIGGVGVGPAPERCNPACP